MTEEKKFDVRQIAGNIGKAAASASDRVSKGAVAIADKTKEAVSKSQEAILNAVDQNGNGEIDIEDIIVMGLRVPGIRIDRTDFLQAELQSKFPQEVIEDAIAYNPLHAGIPPKVIDKIADAVIQHERICVSGISAAWARPAALLWQQRSRRILRSITAICFARRKSLCICMDFRRSTWKKRDILLIPRL